MLGVSEVTEGQTISSSNLDLLSFSANEGTSGSSFRFTADKSYTVSCDIIFIDSVNSAPVASNKVGVTCVTYADITCFGVLDAVDPDGDDLLFEIVEYPEHGLVTVSDVNNGNFSYTPYDKTTGIDSFTYRVRDELGNYSEACEVTLEIEKRDFDGTLDDMVGHWAQSAALCMVDGGYMNAISENGSLYFDPDERMSREEFLYTVMKALGTPELTDTETVFADDDNISKGYGGYVAAAYNVGIISGEETDIGKVFRPEDNITRAEAAVILNNILGVDCTDSTVKFDDLHAIPAWATEDINALTDVGILSGSKGSFFPNDGITRAEVAHMLFLTKNIFS